MSSFLFSVKITAPIHLPWKKCVHQILYPEQGVTTEGYKGDSRPGKQGFALPHCCPFNNHFTTSFPKCCIFSWSPETRLGSWFISSSLKGEWFLTNPVSHLKPPWLPYCFQTHQTLSCHKPFCICCSLCLECFPPRQYCSLPLRSFKSLGGGQFLRGPFPSHPNLDLSLYSYPSSFFVFLFSSYHCAPYSIFYLVMCYLVKFWLLQYVSTMRVGIFFSSIQY